MPMSLHSAIYITILSVFPISLVSERGHELNGIMNLKICRLIGKQCIGGAMRFVESVLGKLLHEIEYLDGRLFGNSVLALRR